MHPVEIGFAPVFGDETYISVFDSLNGRFGQWCNFYIPLVGEVRLNDGPGPVAVRNHQHVRLDLFHQAGGFQVSHYLFAG